MKQHADGVARRRAGWSLTQAAERPHVPRMHTPDVRGRSPQSSPIPSLWARIDDVGAKPRFRAQARFQSLAQRGARERAAQRGGMFEEIVAGDDEKSPPSPRLRWRPRSMAIR